MIAAVGIPKVFPHASPRRVSQLGFLVLFVGLVVFVAALDAGAGPEIVTWPMLLAGLGIGMLASQLGAVTVSSVPDEQSGEVGGLQNTASNLGISIGTALAGAVLISALTSSFFTGIESNPAVPKDLTSKAQTELTSGVPFISDADLEAALEDAGVSATESAAIVDENAQARLDALRASLSVLAVLALDRAVPQPGTSHHPSRRRASRDAAHLTGISLFLSPGCRRRDPLRGEPRERRRVIRARKTPDLPAGWCLRRDPAEQPTS